VKRPEDYRWSSLGYHTQSGNRDGFLSTDFGLVEFNVMDEAERLRRYRRYVYEAGALTKASYRSGKPCAGTIEKKTLGRKVLGSDQDNYLILKDVDFDLKRGQ